MVNDKIDKDKIVKKKCNSHSSKADWRILEDKTIKYVDKETKIPMPLVCSYKDNYFNTEFHKKLIVNCDNLSDEDCSKDDNFCSFNDKCQFNEMTLFVIRNNNVKCITCTASTIQDPMTTSQSSSIASRILSIR